MKRIKSSDQPRGHQPKAKPRVLRYRPRPAGPIERMRAPSAPDLEEADEFLQYHFARIEHARVRQRAALRTFEQAKEAERHSFRLIADHLAACGEPEADPRQRVRHRRQRGMQS